jgi:hypothetical protein
LLVGTTVEAIFDLELFSTLCSDLPFDEVLSTDKKYQTFFSH